MSTAAAESFDAATKAWDKPIPRCASSAGWRVPVFDGQEDTTSYEGDWVTVLARGQVPASLLPSPGVARSDSDFASDVADEDEPTVVLLVTASAWRKRFLRSAPYLRTPWRLASGKKNPSHRSLKAGSPRLKKRRHRCKVIASKMNVGDKQKTA